MYQAYDIVQVKLNGKWGVRSVDDEEILSIIYDEIERLVISTIDGFFVRINDKYGIINKNEEEIVPVIYDEVEVGYYAIYVRKNDKWGLLNEKGEIILSVIFDKICDGLGSFREITLQGKTGIIDLKNRIIIPLEYEDVCAPNQYNTFGVKKDGKWQLVDQKNRPKNSQLYDGIKGCISGAIGVLQNDKWQFIHSNGQKASNLRVDDFSFLESSFFQIKINNKWGVLNRKLEEIIPVEFDRFEIEHIRLNEYGTIGALGIVNETGISIIPPIYENAFCNWATKIVGKKENAEDYIYITPYYIEVKRNNKWGIFDGVGNEKIPVIYDELKLMHKEYDTIFPARLNDKWGYINIDNEVIVPFIYDEVDEFWSKQITEVAIDGKYGLINKKGELLTPLDYDRVWNIYDDSFAKVERDGEVFDINQNGEIIEYYDKYTLLNISTVLKDFGVDYMSDIKTVFVLRAFHISPETDETKNNLSYLMPSYPEFELWEEHIGIYTSLKNAENGIRRHIRPLKVEEKYDRANEKKEPINDLLYYDKENDEVLLYPYNKLYCFWIEEIKLDLDTTAVWASPIARESCRSYLPDGTLWAENLTSETNNDDWYKIKESTREDMQRKGAFIGREPEEISFKKGDIVEVKCGDKVNIGIVVQTPNTIEEMKERKKSYAKFNPDRDITDCMYWQDYSDDIYLVLTGKNVWNYKKSGDPNYLYDHNSYPVQVFSPRFSVSDELKKSLREAYFTWCFHPLLHKEIDRRSFEEKESFYSYQRKGYEMDKKRIMYLLSEMYMEYCGISLTYRTVVYDIGWKVKDEYVSDGNNEFDINDSFQKVMSKINPSYNIEDDVWDVASISNVEMIKCCFDMMAENDEEKCAALCYGIEIFMKNEKWD